MRSVAEYIVAGLKCEIPEALSRYVETGLDTTCAITGERITEGIAWKRVIPSSTAEYLDLMHGVTFPYLSLAAAAAFKGSWNMGSRLVFEDGTMYHPYIGAKSAAKSERTFWSALVRDVWPEREGQNCLCIVAADYKKKVWPRATVGPLGRNTPVYVFDPGRFLSKNIFIDWARLVQVLDFVEEVYEAGFSKRAIGNGLYSDYAAFSEDCERSLNYEQRLQDLRQLPEFSVAILIAQKGV
jgi:hypothetical protein